MDPEKTLETLKKLDEQRSACSGSLILQCLKEGHAIEIVPGQRDVILTRCTRCGQINPQTIDQLTGIHEDNKRWMIGLPPVKFELKEVL